MSTGDRRAREQRVHAVQGERAGGAIAEECRGGSDGGGRQPGVLQRLHYSSGHQGGQKELTFREKT